MNIFNHNTLNVNGKLIDLSKPQVMGILNCTPDSFYAGSRMQTEQAIATRANDIICQGGTMIDLGAFSTRPGADEVSEEEEMARLRTALSIVRHEQPDAILSVDTFRPDVARMAVEEYGAGIINDVSEGGVTGVVNTPLTEADGGIGCKDDEVIPPIFQMVARLGVAYILMSVQPTLETTIMAFAKKVRQLRSLGQKDIILDPGFGFGKTVEENYAILDGMERLHALELPLLVGVSRKSMIFKLLGGSPEESLNGTTAINTIALLKGANILRVHDVRQAAEAIRIVEQLPMSMMHNTMLPL